MKKKLTYTTGMMKNKIYSIINCFKTKFDSGIKTKLKRTFGTIALNQVVTKLKVNYNKTCVLIASFMKKSLFSDRISGSEVSIIGGCVLSIALIVVAALAAAPAVGSIANVDPDTGIIAGNAYNSNESCSEEAYAITVNDQDIVYVASNEEAEEVIAQITNRYKTPNSEIINLAFKENVSIQKREIDGPVLFFLVNDAINYILTGTTEPRKYIVQGGDNLWDIAIANGISPYELQQMNPGMDPKKLSIGKEIYIYEAHPFITVDFTELVTNEERIAYNVIYEDDGSMYKGQTKVKTVGTYGSKEIKTEITKENGVVVASKVLSETILSEPVAQVALRGTQAAPVYTGTSTGQLSSPVSVIDVTSAYGSRGGRHHNGVDLKGYKGMPIYAAADGVVSEIGSKGSFGNIVKLSHGNGLETWYAHCDTIIVNVGDTITKGQQIATMGDTGNATCYHVHFEVRINGVVTNPMNYI